MSGGQAVRPWSRLIEGKFLRNIFTLAGSTAASQLLILATAPVISRLYAPDAFGTFSLLVTFVSFSSAAAALGYERAIVGAADPTDAAYLTRLALALTPLLAVASGGAFVVLHLRGDLGFDALPLAAAGWAVLLTGLIQVYATLRFWHLREERVGLLGRTTVSQNAGRAIFPVVAALGTRSWAGLALGETVGRSLGLWPMVRAARGALGRWPGFPALREVGRRYSVFFTAGLPSTLLNALSIALPLPLIAGRFGAEAAGLFALSQRILQAPIVLVGTSVAEAFHARLARHYRERPGYVPVFFRKTTWFLLAAGAVPATAVILLGPEGFAWAFGERWAATGRLAIAIVPWTTAQLVVSPMSRAVLVLGGQRQKLIYDICSLTLVSGTFWVGGREGWDLWHTVAWLGWAQVIAYAAYYSVLWGLVRRQGGKLPGARSREGQR